MENKSWNLSGLSLGPDSSSSPGQVFVTKIGVGLSVPWSVIFPLAYMWAQYAICY